MFDHERIAHEAEMFTREIDLEALANLTGKKDTMDTAVIFSKHERLFTRDQVTQLAQNRVSTPAGSDNERRLRYLARFITENHIENEVKELNDSIATKSSTAKVLFDGKEIPFRFLPVMVMNEENRQRRLAMDATKDVVLNELNAMMMQRLEKIYGICSSLGYSNYTEMYCDLKGIDFPSFSGTLDPFVANTGNLYEKTMGTLCEKMGFSLHEAEKADISYLFRAKGFDNHFPKEKALSALKSTLGGMGMDLDGQKNIILDIEERPKKSPRAFCMPVSIPNEVYLVTMPRGGQDDYQALLHESGHAEHMATTDASLPFEFKHLGDISVSETYAFLFHYLTTDREWLSQFVRMKGNDLDEFIRFACLNKLYMLRRYSAKLRYELDLHTGSPGRLQRGGELYSKHLGEVLMFKHRENLYLSDMDDGFYSAQYLRAWVFEAQLRAVMKEKFGRMWFSSIDAGKYLKGLYALGQKYTVEELAERAGVGKLSPRPLENEIREALG